ncbi:aconitate hydratase AcnA [Cellulosilyticum sp. I15G10I2]|uniref:aconitate hydratase AcnA n=1 Tax=Cellulosilyticum sp. I15G10I2 TaxID=1892843 RepID=UPI00085C5D62|nr:aconitate hydratase AcnA [Cellulosilyticum sp. I15G10I2]
MNERKDRAIRQFKISNKTYDYYALECLEEEGYAIKHLPYSIKILLEAVFRQQDGYVLREEHIKILADWIKKKGGGEEVPFKPSRVILQDFTGVPAILDLAAMRMAMAEFGEGTPRQRNSSDQEAFINRINPEVPVDLIIDHSVQVDCYGSSDALEKNNILEFERNKERYQFLNWAKKALDNFTVVPPANGIVHQVNLEYLAKIVLQKEVNGRTLVYPDTLVGTDSHTTMINAMGVLGWGVGGIEAEAGMLGQPSYLPIPEVIGVRMIGQLQAGVTATDLALHVTQMLREHGVVNKFVEYFGEGVRQLSLADRATVANMAPEYGATCGFFPVDEETLNYLRLTGRNEEHIHLVRTYLMKNGMFNEYLEEPIYTEVLTLNLETVMRSLAGPKRPQDLILLDQMQEKFLQSVTAAQGNRGHGLSEEVLSKKITLNLRDGRQSTMETGAVVIASITSCTNTSNPFVMLGAGLLAKKAVERGLKVPAHVKTSLTPGSKVVSAYLKEAGLQDYLDQLGFQIAGYGCATCIGNSGPLQPEIAEVIHSNDLLAASVLSGNRNFEGRIHAQVKANYLASPPLVIAYALAGTVNRDLVKEPLGIDYEGKEVYLRDIWPTSSEVEEAVSLYVNPHLFLNEYETIYDNSLLWNQIHAEDSKFYRFEKDSAYIRKPPLFADFAMETETIKELSGLRVLAKLGDSITTDHISPAGTIGKTTPAGQFLLAQGIQEGQFNTYGSRRGNHEVMTRGTFANVRICNQIAPGTEGGYTTYWPTQEIMTIYEAAMTYKEEKTGLLVLAGKDYGMGSSRDWAAKGTSLLGVKAVLAESYERIHRSNLIMMGVLPLQYISGDTAKSLGLTGEEIFDIKIIDGIKPKDTISVIAAAADGTQKHFNVLVRFDSAIEVDYYRHGGILPMVLRQKLMAEDC